MKANKDKIRVQNASCLIDYQEVAVVSREIIKNRQVRLRFSFLIKAKG